MHGRGLFLLCGAVIRSTQSLPACAARSYGEPSRHAMPAPFAGGDLEEPGVMEAALNARAPNKELVFLSVGDKYIDPGLRDRSACPTSRARNGPCHANGARRSCGRCWSPWEGARSASVCSAVCSGSRPGPAFPARCHPPPCQSAGATRPTSQNVR